MELKMTIETWSKGAWYIAKCPELDFVSQGDVHKFIRQSGKDVESWREIGRGKWSG